MSDCRHPLPDHHHGNRDRAPARARARPLRGHCDHGRHCDGDAAAFMVTAAPLRPAAAAVAQ